MNAYISAVNQKVAYAELLLAQARAASAQHHLHQALLQSFAFQLELAYRFYLREIADNYQCKNAPEINDLWALIAHLQLMGKNPAETREIYNLNGDPCSWLSELQVCCRANSQPPEQPKTTGASDGNFIPAVSLSQRYDWSCLSVDLVEPWLRAFSDLVERHRQAMVEF